MAEKDIRCIIIDMQAERKHRIMRSDVCLRDILRVISSTSAVGQIPYVCYDSRMRPAE